MPLLTSLLRPLQQSRSVLPHIAKRAPATIILPISKVRGMPLSTHSVPQVCLFIPIIIFVLANPTISSKIRSSSSRTLSSTTNSLSSIPSRQALRLMSTTPLRVKRLPRSLTRQSKVHEQPLMSLPQLSRRSDERLQERDREC